MTDAPDTERDDAAEETGETEPVDAAEDLPSGPLPHELTEKELAELHERAAAGDEWKDKALRAHAEVDNLRKRFQRERVTERDTAVKGLVIELLPALDAVDRALEQIAGIEHPDENVEACAQGLRQVREAFFSALGREGVEPIEAEGDAFDPAKHEAVAQTQTDEAEPGTVLQDLRRGWRLRDNVLRAAQVRVAAPPAKD